MTDHVPHNEEGVGGAHVYMPWWLDNRKLDFPRGYHIEVWGGLGAQMGGEVFSPMPTKERGYGISTGGSIIHELGCTRMGADPSTSVVNGNCQAHDVRNLFIADGGPFVSQADKNPTWTIMALAMRTSEYITSQMQRGAL